MIEAPIVWGLTLGLGSSLHCAGMCGPIGCSLLLLPEANGNSLPMRMAVMQGGRVLSYVLLGAVVGFFGASLQARLDFAGVHQAVQWLAAMLVIWMGLATAGLLPSFAAADRLFGPVARVVASGRARLTGAGPEVALLGGMAWGFTPCAMVYAALFNSMLTGNVADGMALMLAFGIATTPAVVLSTLALTGAASRKRRPGRTAAGMLMVAAGVIAMLLTVPGSPFCITN